MTYNFQSLFFAVKSLKFTIESHELPIKSASSLFQAAVAAAALGPVGRPLGWRPCPAMGRRERRRSNGGSFRRSKGRRLRCLPRRHAGPARGRKPQGEARKLMIQPNVVKTIINHSQFHQKWIV